MSRDQKRKKMRKRKRLRKWLGSLRFRSPSFSFTSREKELTLEEAIDDSCYYYDNAPGGGVERDVGDVLRKHEKLLLRFNLLIRILAESEILTEEDILALLDGTFDAKSSYRWERVDTPEKTENG